MPNYAVSEIKPFIGSRDYDESKVFIRPLGGK